MDMKRGPIAVVAAVAGLAGALGFHASGSTTPIAPASSTIRSGQNANPTTSTAPKGSSTPPPSSGSGSGSSAPRSATGAMEQYGYGQLAVRVTVNGTRIIAVDTVGLQTAESYSQQIASQVIPLLHNEVLAAQSAQVNGFSGATYTTEAYLYSLQSALDKLHIK